MALSLTTRTEGQFCIGELEGRLTLGPMLRRFSLEVETLLVQAMPPGLILDLAKVQDMDSAGLGELVKVHQIAATHKCRLALSGANARIRQMFEITRLNELFSCYDDLAGAESGLRRAQ
jgi:anti-sigma B factor antagonist